MQDSDPSLSEPNANWLYRWEQQNIGWHHEDFNPHLLNYWPLMGITKGSLVLAPLCGKSRDMVWLTDNGYRVRGIELSPLAVQSFFREQGLQPSRSVQGPYECWTAGDYEIFCGDIFALKQIDNSQVAAVYDRASLVALNPLQRTYYAKLLKDLLADTCEILLVAMDYDQREMPGPPYSVNENEVRMLYESKYSVDLLHSLDLLKASARYQDLGLNRMFEQIYHLRPRND